MRKKRTSGLVAASLLVAAIAASGCQNGETPATSTEKPGTGTATEGTSVTLRFATWDDGELLKIQNDIARKFEASHPGIKIQVESYGDGFDQKLAASFGAKDAPDLMYMWDFPTYYRNLEPLDDMIGSNPTLKIEDIYPGLFNYVKIEGKTYGLPAGFSTRVMYYNKKLFDEANIPYPKDGWTWNEFAKIAKQLSDPAKKQYGFGIRAENDPYDLQGLIWSNEGSFISPDGKTIQGYMNGKETIEVIQSLGNLVKEKSAVLVGGKNQQSGEDIFKAGNIAMWESGVWPLDGFKAAKVDFGTVIMPSFNGKPLKGVIAESAVAIAKTSKHKKEAWEFLEYYSSDEAVKMRTSDLPVRKTVVAEKRLDQDPLYSPFYKMLEVSVDTPAFLLHPNWNQINNPLLNAIEAAVHGTDAAEALNLAVKDAARFSK